MSTSLLYHAFGVRNVVYQKTEYQGGVTIIHIIPREKAIRCKICHSKHVILRGQTERRFRTVPIGGKPVELICSIPRVCCKECGELRQIRIPFAEPRRT